MASLAEVREEQMERNFRLGFADALRIASIDVYLASIPLVPPGMAHDGEFPLLALVDPRPGLMRSLSLAQVRGLGTAKLAPYSLRDVTPAYPHWICALDGRVNHMKRPNECRAEAIKRGLYAGTAEVGLAIYIHHKDKNVVVENEHYMTLPGSVVRRHCADLGIWYGVPKLCSVGGSVRVASSRFGTVVFRR
ncbi:MAG: hypothetical protein WC802_04730 [Patescibacteria group bacterium]|jgi:hypothetical protein